MDILNIINDWKSAFFTAVIFTLLYFGVKKLLHRQASGKIDKTLIKSIFLFLIVLVGLISVILAIPMEADQRGQITNLIGIVLSAVLGLSATTFIGNALAGIALKMRKSFKPGDFITVGDVFGRVTEQGLFHTEVQNIDRDLTSLPNLTLVTNSIKVTRPSGTIVGVECSLGYDVHRLKIEEALLKAAKKCNLIEPYVHIISLGDFSIVYRINGLLKDVKSIISARSQLTGAVIDSLHEAKIEILSPNFMNQKQVGNAVFIPERYISKSVQLSSDKKPENLIFDKAEDAEGIEKRKVLLAEVEQKIKKEEKALAGVKDSTDKEKLKEKIQKTKELKEKIVNKIDAKVDELDNKN